MSTTQIAMLIFVLLCITVICGFNLLLVIAYYGINRKEKRKNRKATIKSEHSMTTKIQKFNQKRIKMLQDTGMPMSVYLLLTAASMVGGCIAGHLVFGGAFFTIFCGFLGIGGPMMYLQYLVSQTHRNKLARLQSSMMLLSGSYIDKEDFVSAVQENVDRLGYPKPFEQFLAQISYTDPNIPQALRRMEVRVNNAYFSQWVDVLILAQDDRQLKHVAMAVVEDMNDMARVQMELDSALFAVWLEYFSVLVMIFCSPLILRMCMPDAYEILVNSMVGQVLLVLLLLAVAYSLFAANKMNEPIEM